MSDTGQTQAGDRLRGISEGGPRAARAVVFRQLLRRKTALVGLVAFGSIVLIAVLAPAIAPHDPIVQDLSKSLRPPFWADGGSLENPLGTDANGRDLASRLIYGARYSLAISIGAAIIGSVLGLVTGLLAGYFGEWVDSLLMRLGDVQLVGNRDSWYLVRAVTAAAHARHGHSWVDHLRARGSKPRACGAKEGLRERGARSWCPQPAPVD
jgi:N-terminal TM domain of oligopeptide transport permease C